MAVKLYNSSRPIFPGFTVFPLIRTFQLLLLFKMISTRTLLPFTMSPVKYPIVMVSVSFDSTKKSSGITEEISPNAICALLCDFQVIP